MTEVVAEPYRVCEDCPAVGTFTPEENKRKCYGRLPEAIGVAACGKKVIPTSAEELYPEIFKLEE